MLLSPHFCQMQFFAYYEAVFYSVTNNKMTQNDIHATFIWIRAIKDASCEQTEFIRIFSISAALPYFLLTWRRNTLNTV